MSFQYQPLRQAEIRVLRPRSKANNKLEFTVAHVARAINQGYIALSYTWGLANESSAESIQVEGQRFAVSRNLYDALRQIQNSKLVSAYIWVDAICINQADDQERSHQVTQMKEIYEQATEVIVWLGKPDNEINNKLAISLMRYCLKQYVNAARDLLPFHAWWWPRDARSAGQEYAELQVMVNPALDKKLSDVPGSQTYKAWEGIVSLWENSWWTRTWVFQEATVPESLKTGFWLNVAGVRINLPRRNKVIFLCGDQRFGWPEAICTDVVASKILSTSGLNSPLYPEARTSFGKLRLFRDYRNLFLDQSFLDTLQVFRHTQCHDPRDKVYSPLCVAPSDVRRYIKPDYATKTVLDSYMDVIRHCLTQYGHELDFLGYARYEEHKQTVQTPKGVISTLPSWVPNFAADQQIYPIPKVMYPPKRKAGKKIRPLNAAEGPSKRPTRAPTYKPLGDVISTVLIRDKELHVDGTQIDTIIDFIQSTGSDPVMLRANARYVSQIWASNMNHTYFTGESYLQAVKKTWVLDLIDDDFGRPAMRGAEFDSDFLEIPPAELNIESRQRQKRMRTAHARARMSRTLGLSQKHYLLMIPNIAAVGDVIWALAGGQVLYVLRPIDLGLKLYRYIGECYAHGLMDGYIASYPHAFQEDRGSIVLL